jgi:hypothetical protein
VEVNICLMDSSTEMVYIIQENKTMRNPHDPEQQLIAEAIAAFQNNNNIRQGKGLDPLDKMTLPMVGTRVTFYLVPVTDELNNTRSWRQRCENANAKSMASTAAWRTRYIGRAHYNNISRSRTRSRATGRSFTFNTPHVSYCL